MVIIQRKSGRLANRVFAFSHFIANAIEYNYTLINTTFSDYSHYFPAIRENRFGKNRIYTRVLGLKVPFRFFRYATGKLNDLRENSSWHEFIQLNDVNEEYDLNNELFINSAKKKIVFAHGWGFRDYKNLQKHNEEIRKLFTPDQAVLNHVRQLTENARIGADIIIGVHMRRGDYKKFIGGKYYFHDAVYAEKMFQLQAYFRSIGKSTSFLLCSDEIIEEKSFKSLNITLGAGDVIRDLYMLSHCDYIVGPPSTFSMWASFYGRIPLLQIQNASQDMSIGDFEMITEG